MGGSSSSSKSSSTQIDRRVAAQDDGIAISGDGEITIDMAPDELLQIVADANTGANAIATQAVNAVTASQQSVETIAANTQPNSISTPMILAAVAVAYIAMRS